MLYVHYNTSTSPAEAFLSFVRALFVASQRDSLPFGGYEGRGKKKSTHNTVYCIFWVMKTPSTNLVPKVFETIHLHNLGVISHGICPNRALPNFYVELFCPCKIRLSVETRWLTWMSEVTVTTNLLLYVIIHTFLSLCQAAKLPLCFLPQDA